MRIIVHPHLFPCRIGLLLTHEWTSLCTSRRIVVRRFVCTFNVFRSDAHVRFGVNHSGRLSPADNGQHFKYVYFSCTSKFLTNCFCGSSLAHVPPRQIYLFFIHKQTLIQTIGADCHPQTFVYTARLIYFCYTCQLWYESWGGDCRQTPSYMSDVSTY